MKLISFLLGIIAFTAVLCSGVCAEKITADPNQNGGSTINLEAESKPGPDLRLSQRITYTSTDKRLHTVLEDISTETGVDIKCGASQEDWLVRDIPVVVCVKALPLGKLMRAIADATHLALSSSTVKGIKHYRIWRDRVRQDQLTNYYNSVDEAKTAVLSAQYDVWAKIKEKGILNNAKVTIRGGEQVPDATDLFRSTCDIMTALPEGSRESVIAGNVISFDITSASPALAQALRDYFRNLQIYAKAEYENRASAVRPESEYQPKPPHELTEAEIKGLRFMVGSMGSIAESRGHSLEPDIAEFGNTLQTGLDVRSLINKNGSEFYGQFINGYRAIHLIDDKAYRYRDAVPPTTGFSPEFSQLDKAKNPVLEKTFKIPRPKTPAKKTFADSVLDIAAASGFSIVCEDFHSHCMTSRSETFTNYDKSTTLKTLLIPTSKDLIIRNPYTPHASGYWSSTTNWQVDPATKMLIGTDPQWWVQHKKLAPEKIVASLITKLNATWLEIDDAAPLLLMSRDQYVEWIAGHKDIGNCVQYSEHCGCMPLWKLYAGLSDDNKALAKSKDGLPLTRINRDEVLAAFAACAKQTSEADIYRKMESVSIWMNTRPELYAKFKAWYSAAYPQDVTRNSSSPEDTPDFTERLKKEVEAFPELKAALEPPPTEPVKILQLVMRLRKVDIDITGPLSTYVPKGEKEKKPHSYSLTFVGNGINVEAGELGNYYPIYSQKRNDELIKAQEKEPNNKGG